MLWEALRNNKTFGKNPLTSDDRFYKDIGKNCNLDNKQYDKSEQAHYPKQIFIGFVFAMLPF